MKTAALRHLTGRQVVLTTPHETVRHVTTPYDTFRHLTTPYEILRHLTRPQDTLRHLTTPYDTLRYLTTPYDTSRYRQHFTTPYWPSGPLMKSLKNILKAPSSLECPEANAKREIETPLKHFRFSTVQWHKL